MLVTTKLTHCPNCGVTAPLIEELDCFLSDRVFTLLQNSRFGFRKKVNTAPIKDALRYKRILVARSFNPAYSGHHDFSFIVNKVKQLTHGL